MAGSAQGEHIFNAVGDLVMELASYLQTVLISRNLLLNPPGNIFTFNTTTNAPYVAAQQTLNSLRQLAQDAIDARDNAEFRTADRGDPANSSRYSTFASITRTAVRQLATGAASELTQGYTQLNRFLDNIDYYTIDQTARTERRRELPATRRD
ncbi:MAG TPA: hypothetical protein VHS97_09130, partial [Isosphaeraceae bacterium]|nr:hypothetical protein [Isosphaeraceae bacterium]